jgi:hypothetical protein
MIHHVLGDIGCTVDIDLPRRKEVAEKKDVLQESVIILGLLRSIQAERNHVHHIYI